MTLWIRFARTLLQISWLAWRAPLFKKYAHIAVLSLFYLQVFHYWFSDQLDVFFVLSWFRWVFFIYDIHNLQKAISVGEILIVKAALPNSPDLPSFICKNRYKSHHGRPCNNLKWPRMNTSHRNEHPNNRAQNKGTNRSNEVNVRISTDVKPS